MLGFEDEKCQLKFTPRSVAICQHARSKSESHGLGFLGWIRPEPAAWSRNKALENRLLGGRPLRVCQEKLTLKPCERTVIGSTYCPIWSGACMLSKAGGEARGKFF